MAGIILFSTLNWALSLLVYQLLLRREKYFNYNRLYLLMSLFLGLLVPIISQLRLFTFENSIVKIIDFNIILPEILISEKSNISVQYNFISDFVFVIYWIGIILFTFRFVKSIFKILSFYKKGIRQKLGNLNLVLFKQKNIAFSFFNYIFITENSGQENEKILKHEMVHVNKGHSFDILVIELIKIVFWFNPMVYIFDYLIKENHEYTADNAVVTSHSMKNYSQFLINQLQSGMQLYITNNFINSLIKNRIKMMYRKKSKNILRYYLSVFIVVISISTIYSYQNIQNDVPDLSLDPESFRKNLEKNTNDGISDTIKIKLAPNGDVLETLNHFKGIEPQNSIPQDTVYETVDEMPRFPGCENELTQEAKEKCSQQKMLEYIYTNLKYPEKARDKGLEGMVIVRFVVDKKARITEIEVKKDPGEGCGQAVKEIVENMNKMPKKWIPGKLKGKKVNVSYMLPVKFKLAENEKQK
jgi:TonB family protein